MANKKITAIGGIKKTRSVAEMGGGPPAVLPKLPSGNAGRREKPVDSVEISAAGRELASHNVDDARTDHGWRVTS